MSGMPGRRWRPENLKPCGTDAAYKRHLKHRESPCDPCAEAHRAYNDQTPFRRRLRAGRKRRLRPGVACAACGRMARRVACGYCMTCYSRWSYHGRPVGGPPPSRAGRLEDFAFLRAQGVKRADAARRVGVSPSTASRYEAQLSRQPELREAA